MTYRSFVTAILLLCLQAAGWAQDTAEEPTDPMLERLETKASEVFDKLPKDLQPRFFQLQQTWREALDRTCPKRPLSKACETRVEARLALLQDTWFVWQEAPLIDGWLKDVQRHHARVWAALKAATPGAEVNAIEADQRQWEARTHRSCGPDERSRFRRPLFGSDPRSRNHMCLARATQDRAFELDQRLAQRAPARFPQPGSVECFGWSDDITTIKAATLATDQDGSGLQTGSGQLSTNAQGVTLNLFLDGYNAHTCEATIDFRAVMQGSSVRYLAEPDSIDGGTCKVELKRWPHHFTLEGEFESCQGCGHRVDWPRIIPVWGDVACK